MKKTDARKRGRRPIGCAPQLETLEARQLLSSQPPNQRLFEFGTRGSSLEPGFALVAATPYTTRLGYGWLGPGGIHAADRGRGADPTTRHLNYGRDKTFLVTLPNGLYDVSPTLGDASAAHQTVSIWLNNARVASNLSTQPGQSLHPTFLVKVTDGQLKIRLASLGGTTSSFAIDALVVKPEPPPKVTFTDCLATARSPVSFTATATAANTAIQAAGFAYTWKFGDGSIGHGANVSHTFTSAGTYAVSVTAKDAYGRISKAASSRLMIPAAPSLTVDAGGPITAEVDTAITFRGSVSGRFAPYTCVWDFGDGTTAIGSLTPTHAYSDSGTYTARLSVTDAKGTTATSTATITVANVAPTVTVYAPPSANVGATVNVMATATDPSLADLYAGFTFNWNFGDGTTSSAGPRTLTHAYATAGTYTVSVTATDKDGATGAAATTSIVVAAANVIPITAAWLQSHGPAPYVLNQSGATYQLQTDVVTTGTAFKFQANNIALDLNGHTITYDNAAPITVTNGGFETGNLSGWDVSAAPHASVVPQLYMWGNYMAQVGPITGTEAMVSSPITIPQANVPYFASLTCHGTYGSQVTLSVIDTVTGGVLATSSTDPGHGGGLYTNFTPSMTNPIKLKIVMSPGTNAKDTIVLDYVQLARGGANPGQGYYGVDLSYRNNITIASSVPGGSITQGQALSYASYPINAYAGVNVAVNAVTVAFSGTDTCGFYGNWVQNAAIKDCTFNANVNQIMNRMSLMSMVYLLQSSGSIDVENNTLSGSMQSGIVVHAYTSPPPQVFIGLVIKGNTIKQNSMWTDGYGIEISSGVQNFEIANNTVIPVKGRGILVDALNLSTKCYTIQNGTIHDNYVDVQEAGDLEYGTAGLEVTAFRLRAGSGVIQNVKISNNTFFAHTQIGLVHTAIGCRVNLWNQGANGISNNILIQGNVFKALILSQDATIDNAFALSFAKVDDGTGLTFIGNTFESNNVSLNLGDNDGQAASGITFVGNTIKKSTDGIAMPYAGIQSAYWISTTHNISLIDMSYQNGATPGITFGGSGVKDFSVGWLLNVTVTNGSGAAVTGAIVTVLDKTNNAVYTGVTNSTGQISAISLVSTIYYQKTTNPAQITTDNRGPFTVVVTSGSKSTSQTLNLTGDASLSFTLS